MLGLQGRGLRVLGIRALRGQWVNEVWGYGIAGSRKGLGLKVEEAEAGISVTQHSDTSS